MICNKKKHLLQLSHLFAFAIFFNQILTHVLFSSRASTINLQCGTSKCGSASARCTKALHPETSWDSNLLLHFSMFRVCLRSFGWRCSQQICYENKRYGTVTIWSVDWKRARKICHLNHAHVSTQPQSNVPAIRWKCLTHLNLANMFNVLSFSEAETAGAPTSSKVSKAVPICQSWSQIRMVRQLWKDWMRFARV